MRRFKYQAMVTPATPEGGHAVLPGPPCRMVVQAHHHETGHSRLFPALVSSSEETPVGNEVVASVVVTGDDAPDWLAPGDPFTLWREGPAGNGVITRRLFV
jgi:hypothetical protein